MPASKPSIAIACGGTGGHLFPGLAIAEELLRRGSNVTLLISPKEIDQEAVRSVSNMRVVTLPAVALQGWSVWKFGSGFCRSLQKARALFTDNPPQAVLAMGGFTIAPPVLAGKACGAATFLHESNTIPGRANRWLSYLVDEAFVGFPSTAARLHNRNVLTTGTPVRPQLTEAETASCRTALGLDPQRPVLLVMGGSQGAGAINQLVLEALPRITGELPDLQFIHLTGAAEETLVREAYQSRGCRAVVRSFLAEMGLALNAATAAVSRSGASSLAELAAVQLPAVLIPYPHAVDNHQYFNARALADAGAALLMEQNSATPDKLAGLIVKLFKDETTARSIRDALLPWHYPRAAQLVAERILHLIRAMGLCRADSGEISPAHNHGQQSAMA